MAETLHTKYRPQVLDEVIGQDATVRSLKKLFDGGNPPHAFLFTGPSGVGKTTLARILANHLKVATHNLIEVDAATNSGIDAMRSVLDTTRYRGLGESPIRFVIVDECHALSRATWQSLLLAIEEPPEHVYWALCTTEAEKVPQTVRTRCHAYRLDAVKPDVIEELLVAVRDLESLDVSDDVLGAASRQAGGSVRQALVYLSQISGVKDRAEALRLMQQIGEEREAVELARLLVQKQGLTWERARDLLGALAEESPESVRLVVVNYVAKALSKAGPAEAARLLNVLSAFSRPCHQSEGQAPLYLAVGEVLFNG